MIACLSPSNHYIEENISTLNYATKASFIQNIPAKNDDPKMKMVNELKEKVRKLEKELSTANNHIQFLSDVTGTGVPGEENKTSGDGKCEFCGKLNKSGFASSGA